MRNITLKYGKFVGYVYIVYEKWKKR